MYFCISYLKKGGYGCIAYQFSPSLLRSFCRQRSIDEIQGIISGRDFASSLLSDYTDNLKGSYDTWNCIIYKQVTSDINHLG